MLGSVLAITTALCWGTGTIFARLGLQRINPSTGTFISMVSSLILVGSLALTINFDAITSLSPTALLWFGLIGVMNYVIGRQFNYLAIRRIGVAKASPIFASASLFAIILAVTFIGERITVLIGIGACCIVMGLSLLVTSK